MSGLPEDPSPCKVVTYRYGRMYQERLLPRDLSEDGASLFSATTSTSTSTSTSTCTSEPAPAVIRNLLVTFSHAEREEAARKRPDWAQMPVELLEHIFRHLDIQSLVRAASVCTRWREASWERVEISQQEHCMRVTDAVIRGLMQHRPVLLRLRACRHLTAEGYKEIGSRGVRLQTLVLVNFLDMSEAECAALLQNIPPSLRSLCFSKTSVGPRGMEALLRGVRGAGWPLVVLDLEGSAFKGSNFVPLGCEGCASVAAMLGDPCCKVEELYLEKNEIGDLGLRALAAAIAGSENSVLRVLSLSHNAITDEGVETLCAALRCHRVQDLRLCNMALGSRAALALTSLLTAEGEARSAPLSDLGLVSLDLSQNLLGDEGAGLLAGAALGGRLRHLRLARNKIQAAGGNSLFQAMMVHSGWLETLDLQDNDVGEAWEAASAMLRESTMLHTLSLNMNSFSSSALRAMLDAAKHSPSLRVLHIDYDRDADGMWEWRGREQRIHELVSSSGSS